MPNEEHYIHNLSELIDFVKKSNVKQLHTTTNSMTWYRGQSDYEWILEPAVYREGRFNKESIYIKEFERLRPSEFQFNNNFDKLVKMQHYGLPTRLLDLTTNPLVALYFACNENTERDGALYAFSTPTFWEDNLVVKIITDFIFDPEPCIQDFVKRELMMHKLPNISLIYEEAEKRIMQILGVPAHAILPRLTNQRILQQSGGFLLFGMSVTTIEKSTNPGTFGKEYVRYCKLDDRQRDLLCPTIIKTRIPAECKKSIIEDLDLLNINEGFLFPELEYQAKNIIKNT